MSMNHRSRTSTSDNQPEPDGKQRIRRARIPAMFGAVGGGFGFLVSSVIDLDSNEADAGGLAVRSGLWFMLAIACIGVALIIGALRVTGRRLENRTLVVSAFALVIGGFVSGYIAQRVAVGLVDGESLRSCYRSYRATLDDSALNWCYANTVRIARTAGWIVAGAIAGVGIGLALGARRNIQNSVAAGAIGGLVGGLLFDTIPAITGASSLVVSQLMALVIIGTVIGAASTLIETVRSKLWLEIRSGEARGRLLVMVEDVARLGSARTMELPVPGDRKISEHHLTLRRVAGAMHFEAHAPTFVNSAPATSGVVQHGDVLTVGSTDMVVNLRGAPPADAVLAKNVTNAPHAGRPRVAAVHASAGTSAAGGRVSEDALWGTATPSAQVPLPAPPPAPGGSSRPKLPTRPLD